MSIKNRRTVSFTHENFETGIKRKYEIKPYHLREYQNRWYVVGILGDMKEFFTFGIDRMEEVKVLSRTFKFNAALKPEEKFNNIIGLTYSFNKLEEVQLSFTPFQFKYADALKIHKSQEVIGRSEKEVIVKLNIIPNFEFKQKILMLGNQVKVLKPKWLAEDVKMDLKEAWIQYGK